MDPEKMPTKLLESDEDHGDNTVFDKNINRPARGGNGMKHNLHNYLLCWSAHTNLCTKLVFGSELKHNYTKIHKPSKIQQKLVAGLASIVIHRTMFKISFDGKSVWNW